MYLKSKSETFITAFSVADESTLIAVVLPSLG